MKKRKNKYAICPSCKGERYQTEMQVAISQKDKLDSIQYKNYKGLEDNSYHSFVNSNFDWACDICLDTKMAIVANPSLQNFCWNPNYSYYDTKHQCRTCKSDFIFSKEEKKYWYETLQFWIDSTAIHCVECRKEKRELKKENTTLSSILKKEEKEISIEELESVIDIYTKWEKTERTKYYQALLKKKITNQ